MHTELVLAHRPCRTAGCRWEHTSPRGFPCWSGRIPLLKELSTPGWHLPWLAGHLPFWLQQDSVWVYKWCLHSLWTHLLASLEAQVIHSFSTILTSTFCSARHSNRIWVREEPDSAMRWRRFISTWIGVSRTKLARRNFWLVFEWCVCMCMCKDSLKMMKARTPDLTWVQVYVKSQYGNYWYQKLLKTSLSCKYEYKPTGYLRELSLLRKHEKEANSHPDFKMSTNHPYRIFCDYLINKRLWPYTIVPNFSAVDSKLRYLIFLFYFSAHV